MIAIFDFFKIVSTFTSTSNLISNFLFKKAFTNSIQKLSKPGANRFLIHLPLNSPLNHIPQ